MGGPDEELVQLLGGSPWLTSELLSSHGLRSV